MKILIALTYYRPHVSGLTIYAERLARALAARGHTVTVLTSQYDRALPREEELQGVRVFRVPVAFRLSKGVIMPAFGYHATRLAWQHDALSLHLPQFDAAGLALRGRLQGKPVVLTYHSDLILPPSPFNWLANRAVDVVNHLSARLAHRIVAYTDDFAQHSPFLSRYLDKVQVINPPVEMDTPDPAAVRAFRERHGLNGGPILGLAVRLAAEKGVEYLLAALPRLLEKYPDLKVAHAGPREQVIGEAEYFRRVRPLIEQHSDRYVFAGTLTPAEMAVFFAACDLHVLPSVNSTETFGLVQVEAALCGTPSVASALPGVRMPTRLTGMGLTVPPRDSEALAGAILQVLADRAAYLRPRAPIAEQFSPARTAEAYEALFKSL